MPYTIELTNTPDAAMLRPPWEGEAAGAVREFIELVLRSQGHWDAIVKDFSA